MEGGDLGIYGQPSQVENRILFKRLEKIPYTDMIAPHRPALSVQSPGLSTPTPGFRQKQKNRLNRTRSGHSQTPISPSLSANEIGATDDRNAKKVQIMDLFSEHQIWTSWKYECAYPRLTSFWTKPTLSSKPDVRSASRTSYMRKNPSVWISGKRPTNEYSNVKKEYAWCKVGSNLTIKNSGSVSDLASSSTIQNRDG
jgi:hypothetical protein